MKMLLKRLSRNPKTQRKVAWHDVYHKSHKFGFPMYKANAIWISDEAYKAVRNEWADIPGMPADRGFFLYSNGMNLRKIPGDTADIGVRYGSSSFYMLKGFNDASRPHHVFDSFEGLSEPMEKDRTAPGKEIFWEKGDIAVTEEMTRENLKSLPQCKFYKGWVPDRFPEVADRNFAFVHIDVDLYEPTLQSLEFFYPRMNRGGIMICDDYGFQSCPGAKRAVDEFFANKPEAVFHVPTGQALIVKL